MDRSKPKGKVQVFPILAALIVSAFFHGFYIGYYFTFILFGGLEFSWKLAETTAFVQMLRKKVPAPVITAIATVLLSVFWKFISINLFLLSWSNISKVASPFVCFMWALPFIAIFASILAPKARRPKKVDSSTETSKTENKSTEKDV